MNTVFEGCQIPLLSGRSGFCFFLDDSFCILSLEVYGKGDTGIKKIRDLEFNGIMVNTGNLSTDTEKIAAAFQRAGRVECSGISGSERAFFISELFRKMERDIVVVLPSQKEAKAFYEDIRFFFQELSSRLVQFPSYNLLPFKRLYYHNETAAARIRALFGFIEHHHFCLVITTIDALMQRLIPKQRILDYVELVMAGEDLDRERLIQQLISGGYNHCAIVEEPGDFSIRGGILDVFSPMYDHPVRIELFGDTVEDIRFFSVTTQRRMEALEEAIILPAREAVLDPDTVDQVIHNIRIQGGRLDIPDRNTQEIIERIQAEGNYTGIESLLPLIYTKLDSFFDYLSDSAVFILVEPAVLEDTAEQAKNQAEDNYRTALNQKRICVAPDTYLFDPSHLFNILSEKPLIEIRSLPVSKDIDDQASPRQCFQLSVQDNHVVSETLKAETDRENPIYPLIEWIEDKQQSGLSIVFIMSSRSRADRLQTLLKPYGVRLKMVNHFPVSPRPDMIYACLGSIISGFNWPGQKMAVITDGEIFGGIRRKKTPAGKKLPTQLLTFEDLKQDDLVVHMIHGIGQYKGLEKLKIEAATNDFLTIVYRDGDRLYVPVDRMSQLQKYMGVEGVTPALDKMGGKSWARVKDRVKKSVEKIAGDLLKIYAERKLRQGISFGDPGRYFEEFEADFPYDETGDQKKAIEDVLHDMSLPTPMDRLVCGDVGYGKTEVALRAAFVAVNDAKQVAVLVPTTVLAEQHFATFSARFERYPIIVACLSRFRPAGEQKNIINGLKTGSIDIVIGTHRLIQKDIGFKDLGLLILDEEQRFGVKHKESLKKIRSTVDVLTLTATPIPRTLHLSMLGIRDISVISTPPEHRRSIMTYISTFDDAIISHALRKELDRKGQIYFVHNNIRNIWEIAAHLKRLVPEIRLDVAHGRMQEDELEKAMHKFVNYEIDLLVCTTIIESGLDIPSANTIIVNRADKFGLSQIYQLRGRVGRSDEQAYAYLFIPGEASLTRNAQKRLKVLMEHSDLGAGFQIAMNDLQIRGGGNILGASQSGHIAAVGYDMFIKMMENAMADLKGETIQEPLDPEINIPMSVFIPENFIPDIDQRLTAYRRLAKMNELSEIADFKAELLDRFGKIPEEVNNLLLKIMLRILAIKAGIQRLDLNTRHLLLYFSDSHIKNREPLIRLAQSDGKRFQFLSRYTLKIELGTAGSRLAQTKNILKEVIRHVNC